MTQQEQFLEMIAKAYGMRQAPAGDEGFKKTLKLCEAIHNAAVRKCAGIASDDNLGNVEKNREVNKLLIP